MAGKEMAYTPPPFTSAQLPASQASPLAESRPGSAEPAPAPVETGPDGPPPDAADASVQVTQRLMALFESLPEDHPIFGEPAEGLVRLPMTSPRANGQCWTRWCDKLGAAVSKEMGRKLGPGTCWMSRQTDIDIRAPTGGHSTRVLRKVAVVRLMAFLRDPTDDNWTKLSARSDDPPGTRPIDTPFSHACGNGAQAANTVGCINGLDHGRFATRQENEDHKRCTNGARALCPGHGGGDDGVSPVWCIFVHADGRLMPCRNVKDRVPPCECDPRCFGPSV